jgi:GTP-binding protein
MALIDDIVIKVKAGKGGDGGRSRKVFYGSTNVHPDGGNGGHGGNVYFEGTANLNDLNEFRFKKEIKAGNGEKGMNKNLDGKYGEDAIILVPLGTTIIDTSTQETVEILEEGNKVKIARGGRGGIGNHDQRVDPRTFKSTRSEGGEGEEKELHLVLNLIADIGLIGLPNAGKSSLLTSLTKATPKIGDYPFTTLEPNLGTVVTKTEENSRVVLADIPGLVEGASQGKGLGIQFLKHIQKTKVLIHCIDITNENLLGSYLSVRKEFEEYDPTLLEKKEIILLTKTDLSDEKIIKDAQKELKKTKKEIRAVSIYDKKGLEELREFFIKLIPN